MPAEFQQVKNIFLAAVEQSGAEEREAFLHDACGDDAALRQQVEALLRRHEQAGSFLESPAQALPPTVLPEEAVSPLAPPARGVGAEGLAQEVGGRIGPYKLLQKLGEGGMGTVWVAEQTEPVKRRVAVKVIKAGMDSRQVIRRFEAERQALAMMDHANIAKVLDAGTTDAGRPYFVMELVKGIPITKYCDREHLSPKERLQLFIPVCQAVQHAHQKGIIHRDLKPSNVLIGLYDGQPIPKVIDFGVAKATGQKLTEGTIFTEVGQIVGTLEYMSPEQAELNNLDIDTRADIYSLGVILYELLAGSPPFTSKQLRGAAFSEMLRMIREDEPPRPSTKLSSSDELPSIAANRHLEPKKLTKLIHGDLDWIAMKCLAKERSRRYETANGLAMDIQRYLANEPVLAGPPSAAYRFMKFLRRNRGPVAAAALLVLALVGGVIGTTIGMIQAQEARRAEAERAEGERKAKLEALAAAAAEKTAKETAQARDAETRAVLDFVQKKVFAAARPEGQEGGLGRNVTLREAVGAALPFVERSFTKQPLTEAQLRMTLGLSFGYLGDHKTAVQQFEAARAIRSQHLGGNHPDTLRAMSNLALAYHDLGRYIEALKLNEETLALKNAKLGPDDPDTLNTMSNLALSYGALGRHTDELALLQETLTRKKSRLGADHPDTLRTMNNLANALGSLGRQKEALEMREETLTLKKARFGPEHPETLSSMHNLANSYEAVGREIDALNLREETLALRKVKIGPDHPDTLTTMNNLSNSYSQLGRHVEALRLREETLVLRKAKLGLDHSDTLRSMGNLAKSYSDLGRHNEAAKLEEEALALLRAKFGPEHPNTLRLMNSLADSYFAIGRRVDAIRLFEETLKLRQIKLGPDHPDTLRSQHNLALAYLRAGRAAESVPMFEDNLKRCETTLGHDHPSTLDCRKGLAEAYERTDLPAKAEPLYRTLMEQQRAKFQSLSNLSQAERATTSLAATLAQLGLNLLRQHQPGEAEPLLRESLAIRQKYEGDAWMTFYTQFLLGAALLDQKQFPDAESLLLEAYKGMKQRESKMGPEGPPRLTTALEQLVRLYDEWGKKDEAAKWRKEVDALKKDSEVRNPEPEKKPQ